MFEGFLFWQFVIMSLEGLIIGIMLDLMFEPKNHSWKGTTVRLLAFWGMMIIIMFPEFLMKHKMSRAINLSEFLVLYVGLSMIFYRLKRFDLLKGFIIYILTSLPMEMILVLIKPELLIEGLDYARDPMMDIAVLTCIGGLAFRSVAGWFAGRRQKDQKTLAMVTVISTAGILILLITFLSYFMGNGSEVFFKSIQGTETFLITTTAYLFFVVAYFIMKNWQGKKEMGLISQMEEIQNDYYRSLEQSSKNMAKLRHDFKNIIYTTETLMKNGEFEKAEELLNTVSTKLEKAKDPVCCENSRLNILIAQKLEALMDEGCFLNLQLDIPAETKIDQMDLCLIFSLMLDHAAAQLENLADQTIRLEAAVKNGTLEGFCRFEKGDGRKLESGQIRIMIDELVSKYKGRYDISFLEKETECRVSLPMGDLI